MHLTGLPPASSNCCFYVQRPLFFCAFCFQTVYVFKKGNDLIFLNLFIADAVSLPPIFERVTSFNQPAKDCLCPGRECEVAASLRHLADAMCLGSVVA